LLCINASLSFAGNGVSILMTDPTIICLDCKTEIRLTESLAVPLLAAPFLRHSLLQVCMARLASEGLHTKIEINYPYLTGPRFRQGVEAIVEAFSTMQEDLDKERKAIMKQWASARCRSSG